MSHRRLISERDVQRAARDGTKSIDVADAVVTPAARDLAARLGVALTGGKGPATDVVRSGSRRGSGAGESRPGPQGATGAGARPAGARQGARAAGAQAERPAGGRATAPRGSGESGRGAPPRAQATPDSRGSADPKPAPSTTASPARPAIAVGADHGGVAMKDAIAEHLRAAGFPVTDMGATGSAAVDYPDFAAAVAREVAAGRARFGVMVDGAGIGSAMAANKVAGARAAMCYDVTTATNAREHNDANVLTLGAGLIGPRLALAIVDTFLAVPYAGGRHQSRVDKVNALDRR